MSVCVATACGDEAIVIEISTAKAPTENVELFVGTAKCDEPACAGGIQPPGQFGKLPGDIYFRDGAKRFVATVDAGGIARFRLEPSDLGAEVRFLLAVGAPNGQTTGARLISPIDPESGPMRVITELKPVVQFDPQNPVIDMDGVQTWSDPTGASTCVMFQRLRDTGEVVRDFVVPDADRDCDAISPDRCDEYIPDASTKPTSLADARCTLPDSINTNCRLGGVECSDRTGGMGACGALPYCVDAAACNCQGDTIEAMSTCLDEAMKPGTPGMRLVCPFPVVRSTDPNDPMHYDVCPNLGNFAGIPLPTGATGACEAKIAKSTLGSYDFSHELAENDHVFIAGVRVLEPDVCKLSVEAMGNLTLDPATLHPVSFAMKVEANMPTARGIIFPVEFHFEPVEVCGEPIVRTCFFDGGGDGLFRCQ